MRGLGMARCHKRYPDLVSSMKALENITSHVQDVRPRHVDALTCCQSADGR